MPVAEGARGGRAGRAGVLCTAGRRLECRDHGLAGDHGGSRGRARAWSAVIKDQFMIMEPYAGDRPAAAGAGRGPARPGLAVPGYSVGGPWWWQSGRGSRRRWLVVAVLAAITRHRRCTWPRGAQQKRPTDAVTRSARRPGPGPTRARAGADTGAVRRGPGAASLRTS